MFDFSSEVKSFRLSTGNLISSHVPCCQVISFLVPVVRILHFPTPGRDRLSSLLQVMGSEAQQHRELSVLSLVPEKDSGCVAILPDFANCYLGIPVDPSATSGVAEAIIHLFAFYVHNHKYIKQKLGRYWA